MGILFWKKEPETLGEIGEKIAVKFLKKNGYKILERNFKNPLGRRLGEIDIIAKEKNEIVFVEVKARKSGSEDIFPEERINHDKLHKLSKIAEHYLKSRKIFDRPYRFDAVTVNIEDDLKTGKIKHLKSIFI
jgi:putative endonuclease